ncbi:hypothetical protein [Nostoc sp.]|uniref:hypothetical protein n=1 Tax=Nostoc sp. TaxID=1180 RepID=UPI002FF10EF1
MIRKTFLAVSVALASIISSSNFNLLRAAEITYKYTNIVLINADKDEVAIGTLACNDYFYPKRGLDKNKIYTREYWQYNGYEFKLSKSTSREKCNE